MGTLLPLWAKCLIALLRSLSAVSPQPWRFPSTQPSYSRLGMSRRYACWACTDRRHLLAAFRESALNSSIRLSTLPSARPAIAPGGFVTRCRLDRGHGPHNQSSRAAEQRSRQAGDHQRFSPSVETGVSLKRAEGPNGPKGRKGQETQRRRDAKLQRRNSCNGDGPLGSSSGQIIVWLQLQMLMRRAQQIIAKGWHRPGLNICGF